MATQGVIWQTECCLPCIDCENAEIILCVPALKVASRNCPEQQTVQPFSYSFIEAQICSIRKIKSCPLKYKYILKYDDSQLVQGEIIKSEDVLGAFCEGCFTQWVKELVGNEPPVVG